MVIVFTTPGHFVRSHASHQYIFLHFILYLFFHFRFGRPLFLIPRTLSFKTIKVLNNIECKKKKNRKNLNTNSTRSIITSNSYSNERYKIQSRRTSFKAFKKIFIRSSSLTVTSSVSMSECAMSALPQARANSRCVLVWWSLSIFAGMVK